jgi:hypothetical protein
MVLSHLAASRDGLWSERSEALLLLLLLLRRRAFDNFVQLVHGQEASVSTRCTKPA